MINPISTGISGLMAASRKLEESAARIAAAPAMQSPEPLGEELVTLKIAEQSYKANAQVIRTARDMQDELLKTFDQTV